METSIFSTNEVYKRRMIKIHKSHLVNRQFVNISKWNSYCKRYAGIRVIVYSFIKHRLERVTFFIHKLVHYHERYHDCNLRIRISRIKRVSVTEHGIWLEKKPWTNKSRELRKITMETIITVERRRASTVIISGRSEDGRVWPHNRRWLRLNLLGSGTQMTKVNK